MNCKKSFHHSPNGLGLFGVYDLRSYSASSTAASGFWERVLHLAAGKVNTPDPGGIFMIGTDFEAYVAKSDEILQAISTKHDDIYLSALFNPSVPETFITDAFALFDALLIIEGGNLSCHW